MDAPFVYFRCYYIVLKSLGREWDLMTLAFSVVFLQHLFCSSSAHCADTQSFVFILIWQEE